MAGRQVCGGMTRKRICHLNYSKSLRKLRSRECSSDSSCPCEPSCSCSMSSSSLASALPILVSSSSSCKTWCRHCLQTRSSHMGVRFPSSSRRSGAPPFFFSLRARPHSSAVDSQPLRTASSVVIKDRVVSWRRPTTLHRMALPEHTDISSCI